MLRWEWEGQAQPGGTGGRMKRFDFATSTHGTAHQGYGAISACEEARDMRVVKGRPCATGVRGRAAAAFSTRGDGLLSADAGKAEAVRLSGGRLAYPGGRRVRFAARATPVQY